MHWRIHTFSVALVGTNPHKDKEASKKQHYQKQKAADVKHRASLAGFGGWSDTEEIDKRSRYKPQNIHASSGSLALVSLITQSFRAWGRIRSGHNAN
jgi:hypothetical protein